MLTLQNLFFDILNVKQNSNNRQNTNNKQFCTLFNDRLNHCHLAVNRRKQRKKEERIVLVTLFSSSIAFKKPPHL